MAGRRQWIFHCGSSQEYMCSLPLVFNEVEKHSKVFAVNGLIRSSEVARTTNT